MVVVWLGTSWVSKAVIAAYLTFFPVTVNMLRGLRAVDPDALALMRALAATPAPDLPEAPLPGGAARTCSRRSGSRRRPASSAPSSASCRSGSRFGMGVVIINAAQYYNWQPANLWAAILVSALIGIAFYQAVAAVERRCLAWRP